MLLAILLDELMFYMEAIWGFIKVCLLMAGGAYVLDITSRLRLHEKGHQDSLQKIEELEGYLDQCRRERIEQSKENHKPTLDDILEDCERVAKSKPIEIRELQFSKWYLINVLRKEKPNLEYHHQADLKYYALKYYEKFNLNISCISSKINQYNRNENTLKAPSHEWIELQKSRQSKSELIKYNWHEAIGLGIILGYNGIRALDIDQCEDFSLVGVFLKELALPVDYEWVTKSGSLKGFHILFYCDELEQAHDEFGRVSYRSKKDFNFEKIDLMWDGHLVLPPTIHERNNNYSFFFSDPILAFFDDKIPKNQPQKVEKKNVVNLLAKITDFKRITPSF